VTDRNRSGVLLRIPKKRVLNFLRTLWFWFYSKKLRVCLRLLPDGGGFRGGGRFDSGFHGGRIGHFGGRSGSRCDGRFDGGFGFGSRVAAVAVATGGHSQCQSRNGGCHKQFLHDRLIFKGCFISGANVAKFLKMQENLVRRNVTIRSRFAPAKKSITFADIP
jgi:hypothetical protein